MFKYFKSVVLLLVSIAFLVACGSEKVTLTLEDGTVWYEGEVNENNEPHGKGIFYGELNEYHGEFQDGQIHGYGVFYHNKELNTVMFEGEWINGEPMYLTPEVDMSKYDITSKTELGFDYKEGHMTVNGKQYTVWHFEKHNITIVFDEKDKVIEIRENEE